MFKVVIVVAVLVIGFIAYTGVDVSEEYNSVSELRNDAYNDVVDPLAKKVLKQVSEIRLDEKIDSAFAEYVTDTEIDSANITEDETDSTNVAVDKNNNKIEITIFLEEKQNE